MGDTETVGVIRSVNVSNIRFGRPHDRRGGGGALGYVACIIHYEYIMKEKYRWELLNGMLYSSVSPRLKSHPV